MSFISGAWNFFKRHRRKFVIVGALAGGVALLNYYGRRKLQEWQDKETTEYFDRMKREQHFESTQKTCKSTINGVLPSFYTKITTLSKCDEILELLKSRPSNKVELWEELKCACFTRLVADIYGSSLITTLMNVQLNVIGGYMFLDAVNLTSEINKATAAVIQPTHAPLHIQQRYLALIQRFLDISHENLYQFITAAVNECVQKVALNAKVSLCDLQAIFNAVRANLEKSVKEADDTNLDLFAFIMPSEVLALVEKGSGDSSWDEIVYNRLINETRDIFESEDCRNVLSRTVNLAFSNVYDHLAEYFVPDEAADGFKNPNDVALPLAKIIPIVCAINTKCFVDSNEMVAQLFNEQKILAANIYESFSQDNKVGDLRNHNSLA